MEMKFYRCKVCGQIVAIVKQTKVPLMCCGKMMEEIVPGEVDASIEKHVLLSLIYFSKSFINLKAGRLVIVKSKSTEEKSEITISAEAISTCISATSEASNTLSIPAKSNFSLSYIFGCNL